MLKFLILLSVVITFFSHATVSTQAKEAAEYAVNTYQQEMVATLAELVTFKTVADENIPLLDNPEHIAFKQSLQKTAHKLGLDFVDHGAVVIIGLGDSKQRLGIITHGDIQPVNPSKWKKSPFELDQTSEPGKLIARGTEDDKGPIATALYAMKSIKDQGIKLTKRIELYVYMAEESDWQPLRDFLKVHTPPQLNITIDAEYPVVTAEKGYGTISTTIAKQKYQGNRPYIAAFTGGFFGSQIPEDASVTIANSSISLLEQLKNRARKHPKMRYQFNQQESQLTIVARGISAHSSKPQEGVNAITYLADLLNIQTWPASTAGNLVNFINQLLGTGLVGEQFGDIAYSDDFMGPMTVAPTVLKQLEAGIQININIRRPVGKSKELLTQQIHNALNQWRDKNSVSLINTNLYIGDPFVQNDAPHIDTLLAVFKQYTGIANAKPIAIGGGTNSRLFPNAVSFGPSMPNANYTGHSEHEFITLQQFTLNLKMYTAALTELATN